MYDHTYGVHLEVDEFSAGEGDDDLPLVDCALHDVLLSRSLPLVHTLVCADVSNTVWVYLENTIMKAHQHFRQRAFLLGIFVLVLTELLTRGVNVALG